MSNVSLRFGTNLAQDLNIDGASENISMIKKKMTKGQYSKAKEMYLMCMQDTLYNCTKKLDLFLITIYKLIKYVL